MKVYEVHEGFGKRLRLYEIDHSRIPAKKFISVVTGMAEARRLARLITTDGSTEVKLIRLEQ